MKKLVLTLAIALASLAGAHAQGTIRMFNITSAFLFSTNAGFGTAIGKIDSTTDTYYFALFIDASAPTSADPLTGGWSVAQSGGVNIVATNFTGVPGSFWGNGGGNGVAIDGWVPGTFENVEIAGWSASLGTTWSQIAAQLAGGYWLASGFYGVTGEGNVISGGGGEPPAPSGVLFGGSGITSGFVLNGIAVVPEPATMALAGLGGLSLLAFRRKK